MRGFVLTATVIAVWEAVVRLGLVPDIIVPAPSSIVAAAFSDGPRFLEAFVLTAFEVILATAIAWVTGLTIGFIAGTSPILARAAAPILSSLFAVPMMIFYPVFIVWLGLGPASKILFGALLGFFPIALNIMNGVRAVDPAYRRMARAAGATRLQIYGRVIFPLALPAIASGLRIGTGLAVIGVLATEVIASLGGLGYMISYHRNLFDTGHVYLGIILALVLVFVVNWGVTRLERRLSFWRAPS